MLACLARKVAVEFGRATGEGRSVVSSFQRLNDRRVEFGQRETTRRAWSFRAALSRSLGGGGSVRHNHGRLPNRATESIMDGSVPG